MYGHRVLHPLEHGCWELNPGPLQVQHMVLTTEPLLQPSPLKVDMPLSPIQVRGDLVISVPRK